MGVPVLPEPIADPHDPGRMTPVFLNRLDRCVQSPLRRRSIGAHDHDDVRRRRALPGHVVALTNIY